MVILQEVLNTLPGGSHLQMFDILYQFIYKLEVNMFFNIPRYLNLYNPHTYTVGQRSNDSL